MVSLILPEFFALLAIDVFLALSLWTCLLDRHFPTAVPYVFQAAALAGFGQLLVSSNFLSIFGVEMRFWYCLAYLAVAVATLIAVNLYLAVVKRKSRRARILAGLFSGLVTFPVIMGTVFFVSLYASGTPLPLPVLPPIPLESIYALLVVSAFVLSAGIIVSYKPWLLGRLGLRQQATGGEVKSKRGNQIVRMVTPHGHEKRERR